MIKTMNKKISNKVTEMTVKGMILKENLKNKYSGAKSESSNAKMLLSAALLVTGITLIALPEIAEASQNSFGTSKSLSAVADTVKKEAQGSMVKILLNIAGVATSAYAIFTQRWTMFALGGAYLIFVYLYFGWVNEYYK
jgi:hypothetical protein